jgi:hypothetical protein
MDKETFWNVPLVHMCSLFDLFARYFHGYQLDLDKIPDKGPAILILYHG